MMFIETVTVSLHYSDYLEKILRNKSLFDRWLIVTAKEDYLTIDLCEKNDLEYIFSDCLSDSLYFRKSKALNEGLEYLNKTDWIITLDSDILLPKDFRYELETQTLNKEYLYGLTGRCIVYEEEELKEFPTVWKDSAFGGYLHMFHSNCFKLYPENSDDAGYDDVEFAGSWNKTAFIELTSPCVHLGPIACNWRGRVSPVFT